MKKFQKNSKGMTLVEVIVAITVFAVMSIGIMTALGASMLQTNKSARRDIEIGEQAEAVGKKSLSQLNPTDAANPDYSIKFSGAGLIKDADQIKLYQADGAQFNSSFGFYIKTFGKETEMDGGLDTSDPNPSIDANEYKIVFENLSGKNDVADAKEITAYVTLTKGYIYEGSRTDGYIHTSTSYTRTSNYTTATKKFNFGYYNDAGFSSGDLKIRFVDSDGLPYGEYSLSASNFDAATHTLTIKYDPVDDPSNPITMG